MTVRRGNGVVSTNPRRPGKSIANRTAAGSLTQLPGVPSLPAWKQRHLMRDLAVVTTLAKDVMDELVSKYGVNEKSIHNFYDSHRFEIAQLSRDIDNHFAGIWIADKESRVAEYTALYEELRDKEDIQSAGEVAREKRMILHAVAEELGQLPGRTNILVVPVQHVVVGIDMEDLK